jgi:ankyrin repeat protein
MSTRMTPSRLAGLVAAGDVDPVAAAVSEEPRLLSAAVERNGQDGWTPLHLAVAAGSEPVVEALVAAGADLSARTEDGRTPLHVALRHSPGLVPVLQRLGAPVDAASAAYLGDEPLLTTALDGADQAPDGFLLRCAAAGGSVATVRVLLDRGAAPDPDALHAAAAAGAAAVVALLLQAGADVDGRDRDTGRTPLHTAVAAGPGSGATAVVPLLLDAGADVNATTHDGASALDIARVAGARARAGGAAADDQDADPLSRLLVAAGATG